MKVNSLLCISSFTTVLLIVLFIAPGCGGESTNATDSGASSQTDETAGSGAEATVVADADPCTLLSIEELQSALPGLSGPGHPDPLNHQCVYDQAFVRLRPMSREELDLDNELFGIKPRSIDVPGADWAVARYETDEGKSTKIADAILDEVLPDAAVQPEAGETLEVFDVIASGSSGTVTLAPTGDHHPAWDGAEHEALVRLLRLAYSRL